MMEKIHEVAISQIDADYDWNCRKDITDESVVSLTNSISENGVETPLVVVETGGGRYALVTGFRRLKSCTSLGHEFVPAFVRDLDEYQAKLANFRENAEREQLSFWEDCLFLKSTFPSEVQQAQIQEDLGRPYGWVRPRRQIWDLPKSIVQLAEQGVYSARDIGELLKRDPVQQQASAKAAEKAVKRGETAKDVRKATVQRRNVRGRTSLTRMMNIIEEHQLCDSKMQQILLWAVSDIDKEELAKRLKVDPEIFLAIEE